MEQTRELILLGVSCLYGLFLFHYLFPSAYHRLQLWLLSLLDRLIELWDRIQWRAKWRRKFEAASAEGAE